MESGCRRSLTWRGREKKRKKRAQVGLSTVKDFEKGERRTITATAEAIRRAIENAGIRLLVDQSGAPAGIARANAGQLEISRDHGGA
jgi:hypothetical protein